MSKPSLLRRLLGACWNAITVVRRAMSNILFLLALVLLYVFYRGAAPQPLPEQAALLLNPVGVVVDEKAPIDPLRALAGGPEPAEREVRLRDIIEAIDYAREDPSINSLVMQLDSLVYVGSSRTGEISRSLDAFRKSGKSIVAVGDYFTQDQYLLATEADSILMHPMGAVALEGYSSYHHYFRQALEKLSVNVHVFRAGEHKSIAEPFLRDDMSPAEKEITSRWLHQLWGQYTQNVEQRRQLNPGAVSDYVDNYAAHMQAQGGDAAQVALQAGLVDQLVDRIESNDYLAELVGATNEQGLYEAVPFEHYLFRKKLLKLDDASGKRVAVITAQGDILPGEQPPGTIGGDTLAQLIEASAGDEDVAALVLRINSGGGSVFASEVIRQQLLDARAAGKPVVVSMGGIAASGGYYIAAQADEIWATPTTITGSIGVFAAIPTVEELLGRFGVFTDGVGTTELAGSLRVDRPLNPVLAESLTSAVQFTYRKFLQIVAEGRDMELEQVDKHAQGRVFGAADALEYGLVDAIGHLEDAIAAAAARAGLAEGYTVEYVRPYRSPRELLLEQLAGSFGARDFWRDASASTVLKNFMGPVLEAASQISALQDPSHLYMRCVACGMIR